MKRLLFIDAKVFHVILLSRQQKSKQTCESDQNQASISKHFAVKVYIGYQLIMVRLII